VIWIDTMINKYYIWKNFPKTITSKLRINHDLILSAWILELQKFKLKATWLDKFNYIIVEHAEEKTNELIRYVVEDLKFIPNKITIYEDRPDYFIENRKFIEDFLWTKLEIMFVEMNGNDKEPKITRIE
jgi:hypothetical protein